MDKDLKDLLLGVLGWTAALGIGMLLWGLILAPRAFGSTSQYPVAVDTFTTHYDYGDTSAPPNTDTTVYSKHINILNDAILAIENFLGTNTSTHTFLNMRVINYFIVDGTTTFNGTVTFTSNTVINAITLGTTTIQATYNNGWLVNSGSATFRDNVYISSAITIGDGAVISLGTNTVTGNHVFRLMRIPGSNTIQLRNDNLSGVTQLLQTIGTQTRLAVNLVSDDSAIYFVVTEATSAKITNGMLTASSSMTVTNSLTASTATFTGNVTATGAGSTIALGTTTLRSGTINGYLTVGGTSTLSGTLTASTLTVSGTSTFSGTLTASTATFTGLLTASTITLATGGNLTLNSNPIYFRTQGGNLNPKFDTDSGSILRLHNDYITGGNPQIDLTASETGTGNSAKIALTARTGAGQHGSVDFLSNGRYFASMGGNVNALQTIDGGAIHLSSTTVFGTLTASTVTLTGNVTLSVATEASIDMKATGGGGDQWRIFSRKSDGAWGLYSPNFGAVPLTVYGASVTVVGAITSGTHTFTSAGQLRFVDEQQAKLDLGYSAVGAKWIGIDNNWYQAYTNDTGHKFYTTTTRGWGTPRVTIDTTGLTVANDLTVSGNATVTGTLTASTATFSGPVILGTGTVHGGLNIDGYLTWSGTGTASGSGGGGGGGSSARSRSISYPGDMFIATSTIYGAGAWFKPGYGFTVSTVIVTSRIAPTGGGSSVTWAVDGTTASIPTHHLASNTTYQLYTSFTGGGIVISSYSTVAPWIMGIGSSTAATDWDILWIGTNP